MPGTPKAGFCLCQENQLADLENLYLRGHEYTFFNTFNLKLIDEPMEVKLGGI